MESKGDALLRERLAALPLETPPAAAWSAIRNQLQPTAPVRAPRRTSPWWLALAAALTTAAIVPGLQQPSTPIPATTSALVPAATEPTELASLMQRSRLLEGEIRDLRTSGADVAEVQYQWERAIESDLALVDVGLSASAEQPEQLWRERVRLLEELKTASRMDSGPLLLQARLD